MKEIFLKLMFNIFKNFMNLNIYKLEIIEIMKIESADKISANLHDKIEYVIHKVYKVNKFNQNAWLKPFEYWSEKKRRQM